MKPRHVPLLFLAFLLWFSPASGAESLEVGAPEILLTGIPFSVTVSGGPGLQDAIVFDAGGIELARSPLDPDGSGTVEGLVVNSNVQLPLRIGAGSAEATIERSLFPGWVTILPPLVAIVLALVVREVFTSLFAGLWLGCLFLEGYDPFGAILLVAGRFAREALADGDHAAIIIFSMLLGGMVGVLTRMGGARAIVEALSPLAVSRRRGQFATWLAGLAIFFDDYANTLIVGNTMRPLTDKLKISREKLAYIVDSTAAPVAAIAFVSTWVGFEISLIEDGLAGTESHVTPFGIFLATIPYLFYPLLALLMVLMVILLKRDFGPMLAAERRAVQNGELHRQGAQIAATDNDLQEISEEVQARWWEAAMPVVSVVATVLGGLWVTGAAALPADEPHTLSAVFGNADPFTPLLWGSLIGCIAAVLIAVARRRLKLAEAIAAWVAGLRSMMLACIILVMAWSLGALTQTMGTAGYLSTVLSDRMPPGLLAAGIFIVAALISFATGTSWTTMAILFPLVIPLSMIMGGAADPSQPQAYAFLLGAIGAVMAGSLFGDHCSPISDTTVMSSMASSCDHVDHVRTQLPYAVVVAVIALLLGAIPSGFGLSPWLSLALGAGGVVAVVRFVGKPVEAPAPPS